MCSLRLESRLIVRRLNRFVSGVIFFSLGHSDDSKIAIAIHLSFQLASQRQPRCFSINYTNVTPAMENQLVSLALISIGTSDLNNVNSCLLEIHFLRKLFKDVLIKPKVLDQMTIPVSIYRDSAIPPS